MNVDMAWQQPLVLQVLLFFDILLVIAVGFTLCIANKKRKKQLETIQEHVRVLVENSEQSREMQLGLKQYQHDNVESVRNEAKRLNEVVVQIYERTTKRFDDVKEILNRLVTINETEIQNNDRDMKRVNEVSEPQSEIVSKEIEDVQTQTSYPFLIDVSAQTDFDLRQEFGQKSATDLVCGDSKGLESLIANLIKTEIIELQKIGLTNGNDHKTKEQTTKLQAVENAIKDEIYCACAVVKQLLETCQNRDLHRSENIMRYVADLHENSTARILPSIENLKSCLTYLYEEQQRIAQETRKHFEALQNALMKNREVYHFPTIYKNVTSHWLPDEEELLDEEEITLVPNS